MKDINTYLNFDGNCRQAMEFYAKCLGAELTMMPFSEAGSNFPPEAKDRIIHARLSHGDATLMASDTMKGQHFKLGTNSSVCVNCEDVEEIEKFFAAMSEKGKVTMPLQDTFWKARFGMLTDQFGVHWMFNYEKK